MTLRFYSCSDGDTRTPSDPADDYWLSDLSDIRIRGDWGLDDTFRDVMVANLT